MPHLNSYLIALFASEYPFLTPNEKLSGYLKAAISALFDPDVVVKISDSVLLNGLQSGF